ncbi:MAG: hypothetical protein A2126_04720 [Candidatus Woykebacteria bacterium GWB1_45_5]|uniref:Uncharacterized protein n=2 Tax=Candidatus Woykeibacteriota TaxID=1817899 RepID=A0A1G1W342_9BACT|nr:MAG: hypothetical protein A2113_02455 [Candidatus Woykebacteria bacterium GWA1_44_8]OGY24791.1 MAG: hypothetical protein A2126_04720 [Candidatus Woykebacteria bacterium GWB1_45_5]
MLSTPHLLVGAAIARSIPNPAISLPAAFFSHFVLDATPHWDGSPSAPFSKKVVGGAAADYLFGATLIFLISANDPRQIVILAGAFLATLPDFILAASRHFPILVRKIPPLKRFNNYHSGIQVNVRLAKGLLSAFATCLAALVFLTR